MVSFLAYHGHGEASHLTKVKDLAAQGMRPVTLDVHGPVTAPRYSAVWVATSGPAFEPFHGLTASELATLVAAKASANLKPAIVGVTGAYADARFAGVLEQSADDVQVTVGLDPAGFAKHRDETRDAGRIATWVSAYGTAADPRYLLVTRPNTGKQAWTCDAGDDPATFQRRFEAHRSHRGRVACVAPGPAGYASIWRDDQVGQWKMRPGMTSGAYQQYFDELAPTGYFPTCVQAFGDTTVTYVAIFAKTLATTPRVATTTGAAVNALSAFDDAMRASVAKRNIRQAALAISRNGKLVFSRGYNWSEPNWPVTQPTTVFRVGSLSKVITAIKVWQLVHAGALDPAERLVDVVDIEPAGGSYGNSWVEKVEIQHLLSHTSGFGHNASDADVADALGKAVPVTKRDAASYNFGAGGKLPAFAPGTDKLYSNCGYNLLGLAIEARCPGQDYSEAVRETVLAPLGLTSPRIGAALREQAQPDEAAYHEFDLPTGPSSVHADRHLVSRLYGGSNLPRFDADYGWVLTPGDMALLLGAMHEASGSALPGTLDVGKLFEVPSFPGATTLGGLAVETTPEGETAYGKSGQVGGTRAQAVHRPADGISMVVVGTGTGPMNRDTMNKLADAVASWPEPLG